MKILIADDSATARFFCIRCLGAAGCLDAEFIEVADGAEALALINEQKFDLLVTDLMMPGIDGIELLRRVKDNEATAYLPVIVVSSAGNPAQEEKLKNLGAIAVLGKPVKPGALASATETIPGFDGET